MTYWCHSLTSKGQSYVLHFKVVCSLIHSTNIDWVVTHWMNGVQSGDTWPLLSGRPKSDEQTEEQMGNCPIMWPTLWQGHAQGAAGVPRRGLRLRQTGQGQWPTANIKVLSAHYVSSRARPVNEGKHRAQDQITNTGTGFEVKSSPEPVQMAIPPVTPHSPYCSVSLGKKYTY